MTTAKETMSSSENNTAKPVAAQTNGTPPDNPFGKGPTKAAAPAMSETDRQKRIEKYARRVYPVSALEALRRKYTWAFAAASKIAAFNATRDPMSVLPDLYFKGDLVSSKATDAELAELGPELTPDQIGALRLEAAAIREAARAKVREMAADTADRSPVRSRWRSLDDLAKLPAPTYLIDKLVPAGALIHFIGMSQSLKSFIALDMALSLATGTPFAGSVRFSVAEHPQAVVYVVAEGITGIYKRIAAWCVTRSGGDAAREAVLRRAINANLAVLEGAAQLGSAKDMADVTTKVIETKAVLCVFDTQARCTTDLEENSSTDQGRAVSRIDALKLETGAAVMVIHHTSKADPRNARGSSAWKGAVDTELAAVRDDKKLVVDLEVNKMKDDEGYTAYTLEADTVTLPGGLSSLVIGPGPDPMTIDPDAPLEMATGKGSAFAPQMLQLAACNCIQGVGLTQTRLAEIANEVVRWETDARGRSKAVRRVCSGNTAVGAVKLLVEYGKLIESRRDSLGHVFYEPAEYPPLDPAIVAMLKSDGDAAASDTPGADA